MSKHYQGFGERQNIMDAKDTITFDGCSCPVCGAESMLKKEYSFDRFGDIQLQVYRSCKHVTVTKLDFDVWVCDNYGDAEGIARLTKADWDTKKI